MMVPVADYYPTRLYLHFNHPLTTMRSSMHIIIESSLVKIHSIVTLVSRLHPEDPRERQSLK